jgi:uncharacterized OsmC-like protein
MDASDLRAIQAPLKERYRSSPSEATVTLTAEGRLGEGITCSVATAKALVSAGLHPATGGTGVETCSGDMILQALVACAGVTLSAIAVSLDIKLEGGRIRAEGDLDFRGTLGVAKDAPVGFRAVRLAFELDGELSAGERDALHRLTERYCVVYQTLVAPPPISLSITGR